MSTTTTALRRKLTRSTMHAIETGQRFAACGLDFGSDTRPEDDITDPVALAGLPMCTRCLTRLAAADPSARDGIERRIGRLA